MVLRRWRPKIIVVMGSAGKTTAHNLIFELLKQSHTVRRSKKANSAFAVPLDILDIHIHNYEPKEWLGACLIAPFRAVYRYLFPYPQKYYVVEIDADRPGEIEFFAEFIRPYIVFWISSYATHTENFDALVANGDYKSSKEALAGEFAKLFRQTGKKTLNILNGDSPEVRRATKGIKGEKAAIREDKGTYAFRNWAIYRKRTEFEVEISGETFKVSLPYIVPRNFGYLVVALYLVARKTGIPFYKITKVLEEFQMPPSRMSVFNGINNTKIIDSSYNSSKEATLGVLEILKNYTGRRKIAVIGDMRELGKEAGREHEEIAGKIAEYGIDQVVLVGPLTGKHILPALIKSGYTDANLHHFLNSYQAGIFIKERLLKENDVVMVKASQNTLYFEIIVEMLLSDKKDADYLCRREPVWEKKRQAIKQAFYESIQ